jgi:hypothetical protein
MLREMITRQQPGEPRRRWFSSPQVDLFVWVDDQDAPIGFQLCYGKQSGEHALTWSAETGFSHMAVDGGEARPGRYKGAPILLANGSIDAEEILAEFLADARQLPHELVELVAGKVREAGA